MGYNTTVLILNDGLDEIERDPDFGKKLAAAIRHMGNTFDRKRIDVPVGNHANCVQVIETHHSAGTALVAMGGNYGTKIAEFANGGIHHTRESQWDLLDRARESLVRDV